MQSKLNTETENKKAKIVIIDDHPIVRQGLAQIINQEDDMMLVGEAGDAAEALQVIKNIEPDLIVIDISLKGTSGIELTRDILSLYPEMLILILSMHDESLYTERALKVGAKGYLMKQEATENVVSAIHKILSGETYISDKMKDMLVNKFINRGSLSTSKSGGILTDRELEVLQLVGQGYSTRQIADNLNVSVKTVESHHANIKGKLDLKNSHELIQYAIKWYLSEK